MHWPPPKRRDPTPGKRGAGFIFRACDGSVTDHTTSVFPKQASSRLVRRPRADDLSRSSVTERWPLAEVHQGSRFKTDDRGRP